MTQPAVEPQVIHSSDGRLRLHFPLWSGKGERQLEAQLRRLRGVHSVQANSLTGNVLLLYDPQRTSEQSLLAAVPALRLETTASRPVAARQPALSRQESTPPSAVPAGRTGERQARLAVKGLDRNPGLGRRIVQLLQRKHGVRAHAKPLTGHILVEYDHYRVLLKHLLDEIANHELPDLPGEDRPEHPLDPAPLWQNLTRALGSLLGLCLVTYRRLTAPAASAEAGHGWAAIAAGLLNLLHGHLFLREPVRRFLGKRAADVASSGLSIITLALADSPLGLIVSGVESLLLTGEVTARRAAWRRYEESLDAAVSAEPGSVLRLEAGARVPRAAQVIEGTGTASSHSGLPLPLSPGATVPAGAILAGGPFVLELQGGESFEPAPRPAAPRPTLYDNYLRYAGPLSFAYAALTALRTASLARTFEAMLLLNPRPAVIGQEVANLEAAARALRSGLTVIGTRPDRVIRLPNVLLLDGPRLLTDGLEIVEVLPPNPATLASDVLALAAIISTATGSPWGNVFPKARNVVVSHGAFNGLWATATVDGIAYTLGPPEDLSLISEDFLVQHQGGYVLELRYEEDGASLGLLALRPRLSPGTDHLVKIASRLGVTIEMLLPRGASQVAHLIAQRAGVLVSSIVAVPAIRRKQKEGALVAFVSDSAEAAAAFAACDLAIGIASSRSGEFPARTDLLAPDLRAVADLLEAGARREQAVQDGILLSMVSNGVGCTLGLLPVSLGPRNASRVVYLAALAALAAARLRLRGGQRPESTLAHLVDPRPERWGRRSIAEVLHAFRTTEEGLGTAEALARRQAPKSHSGSDELLAALRNQLRTPITLILAGGACLTLVLGQPLNTALLTLTISLNVGAGIWQEREVGKAAEALKQLTASTARVLRDGRAVAVAATEVVPGDLLLLGPGTRVAADARMLTANGLEVDEAALTGESLPVAKGPDEITDTGRIVLEGSVVVVGTGRAIVVAVGRHTRMGATAAALNVDRPEESPMGTRLGRVLHIALPVAAAGGAVAGLAGLLYGGLPAAQLTIAVTTALSAIPEGLPLLASVGQAGVASRLAKRQALVRRVAAIEALGRVDVACTDKTGTLTEGRLALRLVADLERQTFLPGPVPAELRPVLLTAALASPNPAAPDGPVHPTDLAVLRGALAAGLGDAVRAPRLVEIPFDSARAFHASLVPGRLCVKGAPERLVPRCVRIRSLDGDYPLDDERRFALLSRVASFAERGLRVLLVAEGPPHTTPDNPQGLTALGFVGISDPLRPSVPEAMRRCQAAGIRVLMLTGDHPATARAIAREAGLLSAQHNKVLRAADLAELSGAELDQSLEDVAVIARATPLDKLRIIESLRRLGHIVAMTGDGVNDAPSLRLADVGVAMGRGGTEVARQAADLVLLDDDFATLVESLVEGRGFWRNMRSALGLLLGGNAGELGLIVGASLMGFGSPLTPVQILLVNMITDVLPCIAVVLQRPRHRDLARLAREGLSALDRGLRWDVLRRGLATTLPSLGAYLFMQASAGPAQASAVAFTSIVATQLAQTLDSGRVQGLFSQSVVTAVGASAALLVSAVTVPPVRNFLGLLTPSPLGWGVVGISAATAVAISRAISELSGAPIG